MMRILSILFFLTLATAPALLDPYRQKLAGTYEVHKYKKLNPYDISETPELVLNEDHTFLLKFYNAHYQGTWRADDYGAWSVIDFTFADKTAAVGKITGADKEVIELFTPAHFRCKRYRAISFKRAQNTVTRAYLTAPRSDPHERPSETKHRNGEAFLFLPSRKSQPG
ncbi:MAG: hypothetical protein AB1458_09095 [Bacteroidota bacterium]